MTSSIQQEPTEHSTPTAIEGVVATMRLMHGIEAKIAAETPLDQKEIDYLYQLDLPAYERTRDEWPWGYYDDDDPALSARIERYRAAKRGAYDSTVAVLREDYGDDADWLLAQYGELDHRVEELLAAGATPSRLAENLSPATRLEYFELLCAHGVSLDPHEVYTAFLAQEYHRVPAAVREAFINTYAEQLVDIEDVSWRLASTLLRHAEDGEIEKNVEDLLRLGIEHKTILSHLSGDTIEARFRWLQDSGFDTEILISRCGTPFILDNFDTLFHEQPEQMAWIAHTQKTTEAQVGFIIALYRNGQPVDTLLKTMNSGPHFTHTPHYEALLAAGIGIDAIVDTFSGEGESLIHIYAAWLMKNGANPDAIKAKFTPEGIIATREALRSAGIEVNVQAYVDQLPASSVIARRHDIEREEGVVVDYDAQLEAYEYELDARVAFCFLAAGVDPQRSLPNCPWVRW